MDMADLHGTRILVAEDEYLLADDLRGALVDAGAEVLGPVPSVEQAAGLLGAESVIDFALLDVNLRGEMVFEIADALKERGIPFAFVTGYDRSAIPERYADVRIFDKPLRPEHVAGLVSRL